MPCGNPQGILRPMRNNKFSAIVTRTVFFAGLVSLFMDISSEMVYPLVPLFLTDVLGATKITVGVIEGIAEATASLLKVFSGYLSDRLGKRKLLMAVGYGISAVSRPVIAGASSWTEVMGARFIDRFGKGIRTAPRDAIIADSVENSALGSAFGFHRAMDTIGATIGPALAFALLFMFKDNLRLVFYASTIPALIAVFLIIFFIKEKARPKERTRGLPSFAIASFNGPFRRYMAVIALFSLANFADAFLILKAQSAGVRKELIIVIYLVYNLVYALSAVPMGMLGDRIGLKKLVAAGLFSYSLIFLGLAFAASSLHMWLLFPLYGIYKGMSDGTQRAYLATLAPEDSKATAFGVYHTVSGVMLLPASVIAGFLWDSYGPAAAFAYGSALSFIAGAVFIAGREKARVSLIL